jgi:IS5 family transposase
VIFDHDDAQVRTGSGRARCRTSPYNGHTLAEASGQAAILSEVRPEGAVVDRSYQGVTIDAVKIFHPRLWRGIAPGLRAMIKQRSAIEPTIGHMKADGKLDRNWLRGALGNAMQAVLWGENHTLRMILRKLTFFCPRPHRLAQPDRRRPANSMS